MSDPNHESTRFKYPQFWSASRTDQIANLERELDRLNSQLKTLATYIDEQARVADANSKEWFAAPGGKENSAYRAGMWFGYNDARNRIPHPSNTP